MLTILKLGKWLSLVSGLVLAVWLLAIVVAVGSEPPKQIWVMDGAGGVLVSGKKYVILRQEHWWRDAVVVFGPYLTAFIVTIFLFRYCDKRLRSISPTAQ